MLKYSILEPANSYFRVGTFGIYVRRGNFSTEELL